MGTILITTNCNKTETATDNPEEQTDIIEFNELDVVPEFPNGGNTALMRFIGENTSYPQTAKECEAEGICYISFIISKEGRVSNVTTKRFKLKTPEEIKNKYSSEEFETATEALKTEAIRVISSLPNWAPGKKDGKFVNVQYVVPINFQLK
jgi:protein TonB